MREAATAIFDRTETVFEGGRDGRAVELQQYCLIAEGQFALDVTAGQCRAGVVDFVSADTATVRNGDVGAHRLTHGVSDQVADSRFTAANGCAATVEFRRGRTDFDIELSR